MTDKNKELYEKMAHLQWLLHRQHQQSQAGRGPFADPSRGQGRVLALLKLQPEISTKDLAYLLGIRQQSLSELLGKLEKAGYITRSPLETDKRVVIVRLTDKGKEAPQERSDVTDDLFDCLTEEEQTLFDGYLSRIIAALEEKLGVDEAELERWMVQARSRMGNDAFDHLMSMRGHGFWRDDKDRSGFCREERADARSKRRDDRNERRDGRSERRDERSFRNYSVRRPGAVNDLF